MRNIIKNQKYLESDGSVMVSPLKNITRNNKWVSPLALVEVTIDRDISLVIIQISRGAQKKSNPVIIMESNSLVMVFPLKNVTCNTKMEFISAILVEVTVYRKIILAVIVSH